MPSKAASAACSHISCVRLLYRLVCIPHASHLADVQRLSVAARALTTGRAVFYYSPPRRPTALRPGAHCMPGVSTRTGPAAWCRYCMILVVCLHARCNAYAYLWLIFISMPGHAIPVRVSGAIVAIRAGQPAVRRIIEVAEPPRAVHPCAAGRIEGGLLRRCTTQKIKYCLSRQKGACCPSGPHHAGHSPRFLPDPASRGTPSQFERAGPPLPFAQGSPQSDVSRRLPNRQGLYTPAPPGEEKAALT